MGRFPPSGSTTGSLGRARRARERPAGDPVCRGADRAAALGRRRGGRGPGVGQGTGRRQGAGRGGFPAARGRSSARSSARATTRPWNCSPRSWACESGGRGSTRAGAAAVRADLAADGLPLGGFVNVDGSGLSAVRTGSPATCSSPPRAGRAGRPAGEGPPRGRRSRARWPTAGGHPGGREGARQDRHARRRERPVGLGRSEARARGPATRAGVLRSSFACVLNGLAAVLPAPHESPARPDRPGGLEVAEYPSAPALARFEPLTCLCAGLSPRARRSPAAPSCASGLERVSFLAMSLREPSRGRRLPAGVSELVELVVAYAKTGDRRTGPPPGARRSARALAGRASWPSGRSCWRSASCGRCRWSSAGPGGRR